MRTYLNFNGTVIHFNENKDYLNFDGVITSEQKLESGRINSMTNHGGLAGQGGIAGSGGGLAG